MSFNNAVEIAQFENQFKHCLSARIPLISQPHQGALRLFNGYYEGCKGLVVDLYAGIAVISDHSKTQDPGFKNVPESMAALITEKLPWVSTILFKKRNSFIEKERLGVLLYGSKLPESIAEYGVRYALDLRLNQDDSFYPDTRLLRQWLLGQSAGKKVLNCFAYTGSLGIAALAGGARYVMQTDLNHSFLDLAKKSAALNAFSGRMVLMTMDFFKAVSRLKTSADLFDIVMIDPPFFSSTKAGKVDLLQDWPGLINKVRPLVAHNGKLIVINNALFASGAEVTEQLKAISHNGYVSVEEIIPIPQDCTGFPHTVLSKPLVDPAPYNHSTKMTVLNVRRKDERGSATP
ncbi:MAG: class I SAM-dependent methyltransferase [Anaerolineaceae bacterium]|nr:class I SAM-dependent methyltransferase [Anaerolineaceae bacterium]